MDRIREASGGVFLRMCRARCIRGRFACGVPISPSGTPSCELEGPQTIRGGGRKPSGRKLPGRTSIPSRQTKETASLKSFKIELNRKRGKKRAGRGLSQWTLEFSHGGVRQAIPPCESSALPVQEAKLPRLPRATYGAVASSGHAALAGLPTCASQHGGVLPKWTPTGTCKVPPRTAESQGVIHWRLAHARGLGMSPRRGGSNSPLTRRHKAATLSPRERVG